MEAKGNIGIRDSLAMLGEAIVNTKFSTLFSSIQFSDNRNFAGDLHDHQQNYDQIPGILSRKRITYRSEPLAAFTPASKIYQSLILLEQASSTLCP